MFMTTQPWHDEDYTKLISNLEPPPPPSNDIAWELHFCKWWGWNWVKKREEAVEEPPVKTFESPKPVEAKKPEKKPVKHLCRCLCFKKKKRDSLQDKYNTPSNSVIDHNEQPHDNTFVNKEQPVERTDSIIEKEIEDQIIKETGSEVYAARNGQKNKKKMSKEWSSSSTEEYHCHCRDRNRSSTEESVEYINITCQCCNSKEAPLTHKTNKSTNEKYTQDEQPEGKVIATQTEINEKKRRRKRICVVCCCSCKQNFPSSCCACCSCGNIRKGEEKTEKRTECFKPEYHKREKPLATQNKNTFTTYRASTDQPSHSEKTPKKPTPKHIRRKFEPLYATGMPIDTMLYQNNPITKFGMPSQNYSWIHATKSDIWDQLSHLRMSHESSNLLPGKSSNLSPIKLHDLESEPSATFNLISIDKELETLKKIESDIKMDLKSRVMLDVVCDAILEKNKDPETSSSIFLNEFTYPSNVAQMECVMDDTCKSEQKSTCSKLNQTGVEGIIFEDTITRLCKSRANCETNTSSLNLSMASEGKTSLRDYVNVRSPQTYAMHNSYNRRLLHDACASLDYNRHREHSTSNTNKYPCKLLKYTATNDYPLIPTQRQPSIDRTKLLPTFKRCASPSPRGRDIKKVKLEETSTSAELESTNVSDIFKKIDEIVLRSKVNNEEIQSVLDNIPKRTYKLFTSWEVSNLISQIPSLHQNVDQGESIDSCVTVSSEDKKEKNDKAKTPQAKKKKVCSKPSMIPKRVSNSKSNKKNVGG